MEGEGLGEEETGTVKGQKLRAEGEHLGKSVAEIRGPCSLLSLVFVTEKWGDSSSQDRNPPGTENMTLG